MISTRNGLNGRTFGPLYWLPDMFAFILVFYAGGHFQSYCETGNLKFLALASVAVCVGITLATIEMRSRVAAVFHSLLCLLNIVIGAVTGKPAPFMFAVLCLSAAGAALIPRLPSGAGGPTELTRAGA